MMQYLWGVNVCKGMFTLLEEKMRLLHAKSIVFVNAEPLLFMIKTIFVWKVYSTIDMLNVGNYSVHSDVSFFFDMYSSML